MDKMKRIVTLEPYRVEIQQAEIPVPGEGEVLLKLLWGGICGSDLSVYRGTISYTSYPRVPGHEFSAEVLELGAGVEKLRTGMVVTANPYFNCGVCYSCRRGLVNCCTSNRTCGVQRDGVFSQYCVMPAERIIDGNGLDAQELALVEPFCIGYHGVAKADVKPGERVLVIGAGTIGMAASMSAVSRGAEVTLCDVAPNKLRLAAEFGVAHTILNDSPAAFLAEVARLTCSDGYDVAVEAVGLAQTVDSAIRSVAFGGRVVLIGVVNRPLEFNFDLLRNNELTLMGSRNAVNVDFKDVIDIVRSGRFDLKRLVTGVTDFEQAASAFMDFDKNGTSHFKTMLKF